MQRRFAIFDVFAERPMCGNQLAVVFDADDLSDEKMQAIAAEFAFSETIFIMRPQERHHAARLRIFTPGNELPFAGHPTVGGAVAVAISQGMHQVGQGIVMLEEAIGPLRCSVRFEDGRNYADFELPKLAKRLLPAEDKAAVARALSLEESDIGFENHIISNFDAGLSYDLVPVKGLEAVGRAAPRIDMWRAAFGDRFHNAVYVYCRDTIGHENDFHARMFAPEQGIVEDPATGSAVAAFAGAVSLFDDLPDGSHTVRIEQGVEMGRPSLINLDIEMHDGKLSGGRIGGHVSIFAQGQLEK